MSIAQAFKKIHDQIPSGNSFTNFDSLIKSIAVSIEKTNGSIDATIFYGFDDGSELGISNPESVIYPRYTLQIK